MKSKIVFTEENGTWSAHDPNVAGVYGLGPTREAAEADLAEAKALLGEYDASQADDEDEDAEDVRLADESRAEIRAGGVTIPLEDVLERYGLAPAEVGSQALGSQALGSQALGTQPIGSQAQAIGTQPLGTQSLGTQPPHVQDVDNETLQRRWKRFLRGDGVDPRPEVAQFLANIKAALPALEAENEDDDTEDGVYRFYYGSWKVYGLQERTERIVAKLRALAPVQGKSLCTDFEEIVAAGIGKEWEQSHNAEWSKHTRPIVEAYFHARYFLVVAIEYGAKYERPPSLMDSGWAALLVLYGLR